MNLNQGTTECLIFPPTVLTDRCHQNAYSCWF